MSNVNYTDTYHRGVHTHMYDIKPADRWSGNDNYERILKT